MALEMTSQYCPSCAKKVVPASGIHSADILLVGEFPGKTEMDRGIPFAVHSMYSTAGKVLRTEMAEAGIEYNRCRVMNLWLHEPSKDKNCFQVGYENVLMEAKGRKAILLIGSLVVETFTEYKVSHVSGLQVDSAVLSCPIIYAMVNPAICFQPNQGIGEVRLSIRKFAQRLEKEGLL